MVTVSVVLLEMMKVKEMNCKDDKSFEIQNNGSPCDAQCPRKINQKHAGRATSVREHTFLLQIPKHHVTVHATTPWSSPLTRSSLPGYPFPSSCCCCCPLCLLFIPGWPAMGAGERPGEAAAGTKSCEALGGRTDVALRIVSVGEGGEEGSSLRLWL